MNKKTRANRFLAAGSYTVEAAWIIPLILGIVFAWLFQLFYLHDQVVLNGMLKQKAFQEEIFPEENEGAREQKKIKGQELDGKQKASEEEKRTVEIQSRLWLLQITSFREKQEILQRRYIVTAKATWKIPVMQRFLKNHFTYQTDVVMKESPPDTLLRLKGGDKGWEN